MMSFVVCWKCLSVHYFLLQPMVVIYLKFKKKIWGREPFSCKKELVIPWHENLLFGARKWIPEEKQLEHFSVY